MNTINSAAKAAQDAARRSNGRFGEQPHSEPARLGLTNPVLEPKTYGCPDCENHHASMSRGQDFRRGAACGVCGGSGTVTVDPDSIRRALTNSRTGEFRASNPKRLADGGTFGAAYAWRMIRFHSGADMTMPVMATYEDGIHGSGSTTREIREHLDGLVDELGADFHGQVGMMRGTARWGKALGMPGADQVYAAVDRTVGIHPGAGYDTADPVRSPEAAVDSFHDYGEDDAGECDRCGRPLSASQVANGFCPDCDVIFGV